MICLCLLILLAIGALFVWNVPGALGLVAVHLIARKEALDAARQARRDALRHWKVALRCNS